MAQIAARKVAKTADATAAASSDTKRKGKAKTSSLARTEEADAHQNPTASDVEGSAGAGAESGSELPRKEKKSSAPKKKKKSAPIEVSSNKRQFRVPVGAGTTQKSSGPSKRPKPMDPRFLDHCGKLDVKHVSRNYAFLEENRKNEVNSLKAEVSRLERTKKGRKRTAQEIAELEQNEKSRGASGGSYESRKKQLQQLQQEEKRRNDLAEFDRVKSDLMKKEKDKVLSGRGKAFFHSDAAVRKQVRQAKLEQMGKRAAEKREAKLEKRKAGKSKKVLADKGVRKERAAR
eukprot:g165.t1